MAYGNNTMGAVMHPGDPAFDPAPQQQSPYTLPATAPAPVYAPEPPEPKYISVMGPDGKMKYSVNPKFDNTGYDLIKNRATGGVSPWATSMLARNKADQQTALDQAMGRSLSGSAAARASLASRGGYSSGAGERIARDSARDLMTTGQTINRQGQTSAYDILGQDDQSQQKMAGVLAGLDAGRTTSQLDADKFNAGATIDDVAHQNLYNSDAYKQKMAVWGANHVADQTANDKGGSWLCTRQHETKRLTAEDLRLMSKFRRFAYRADPETTRFYISRCAPLIGKLDQGGYDWARNSAFVTESLRLSGDGLFSDAWAHYRDHVVALIEKYWPECRDPAFLRIQQIVRNTAKAS